MTHSKNNWPVKKLGEVLELVQNGINVGQSESGKYPISRIETLQNNTFDSNRIKFVNLTTRKFERYKYEIGDIAFSHINSYEKIGKVALYDNNIKNLVHGVNLLRFKTKKALCLPKYLFFILQTKQFRSEIEPYINKAVNQASINQTNLKNSKILTPPIDIQKKIIERLDVIRKAQELNDLQISKTEELFKSLLYKVFNKLRTSQLRILAEISKLNSGGTPSRGNSSFWINGKIPWYSSGELNDEYTKEPKEYITNEGLQNSNAKLFPRGTLLIGMYDTAALKMSILDREATFNQAIAGVTPDSNIDLKFIMYFIEANKAEFLKQRVGIRQRNLSLDKIKNFQIPSISKKEQVTIVEKLSAVQDYKKLLLKQKHSYKELFDSVLDKCLKGEIVN